MIQYALKPKDELDRLYAVEQLRRCFHPLRRLVKEFYLRNVLRDVRGPTLDFGCGSGQLLERLPTGSEGLEVNPYLIEGLRGVGLKVRRVSGEEPDFELQGLAVGQFRTLVLAHVLEHLPDPAKALRMLLAASLRLGIERVIVVVPGAKGYASDYTHMTFIDRAYIENHQLLNCEGFSCSSLSYFPGAWEWLGRYFIFHEMKVVFHRIPGC